MKPGRAPLSVCVVGTGRAGTALAAAWSAAGLDVTLLRGTSATEHQLGTAEVVVLAVPDRVLADVAARFQPDPRRTMAHLAGALRLAILDPHPNRASLHPLVSIPNAPEIAAQRVRGAWWAIAGEGGGRERAVELVASLDGRTLEIPEARRAEYHATAVLASNHTVGLWGQVERRCADLGIPAAAFGELFRSSAAGATELGAAQALTGPVARGDWDTVRAHLATLSEPERSLYLAGMWSCALVAGIDPPPDLVRTAAG
jgi:predicted short-subunit dehydrogenase-like oxidoreductase (DUF2520 family)